MLKDTVGARVFIYIYIFSLATYFGSLVTQFLGNLDVFVCYNRRCRRAYIHISLKIPQDPKHVAKEEYVYTDRDA